MERWYTRSGEMRQEQKGAIESSRRRRRAQAIKGPRGNRARWHRALSEATGRLVRRCMRAGPEGATPDMGDGAPGGPGDTGPADDAVDAEFEEVKDDDKR